MRPTTAVTSSSWLDGYSVALERVRYELKTGRANRCGYCALDKAVLHGLELGAVIVDNDRDRAAGEADTTDEAVVRVLLLAALGSELEDQAELPGLTRALCENDPERAASVLTLLALIASKRYREPEEEHERHSMMAASRGGAMIRRQPPTVG